MDHKTVLVLDDEEALVLVLIKELEQAGFKVYGMQSKRVGLAWLREHRADVIITDINSPDLNGFQFLEEVRADPYKRDVPVIFWSGMASVEVVLEAKHMGAPDFIIKPGDQITFSSRCKGQLTVDNL